VCYKGLALNLISISLSKYFSHFLTMSRLKKRSVSVAIDLLLMVIAISFAISISSVRDAILTVEGLYWYFMPVFGGTIVAFIKLGLYRAVVRFIGSHALLAVMSGIMFSGMFLFLANQLFQLQLTIPTILNYMFIALMLVGGARLTLRALVHARERKFNHQVLIYGAGASGRQLLLALENSVEFRAVAFLDDDPSLHGVMIKDVRVYSPAQINMVMEQYAISRVLLALPSASRAVRAEILNRLEPLGVPILTIPGMADIVEGKMKIDELQDVKIEDLLGRDPVRPIQSLMTANISNKVVMVTGAGGSIGSELCRQILQQAPKALLVYELSEFSLYEIDKELSQKIQSQDLDVQLLPLIGSVQDSERLRQVMASYQVETVYHAAAYKHVPLVEFNVVEAVRNNVFGTWRTAEAAISCGVKNFVLISTDKAVRPTNVMGTTKRLAELVLQALAQRQQQTRFCMVRFGNVLGSSGSVVPLFRKQIKQGGPITLTHEDITRYFMTIPEASQLVIQAGAMGKGGDVFVLDMGEPVRIYDLAMKMIHLMGLQPKTKANPAGDIEIKVTGLRPGEKLYEELLIGGTEQATKHPRIKTASEVFLSWSEMLLLLTQLESACQLYQVDVVRQLMLNAPTGFNPTDNNCDLVWGMQQRAVTQVNLS
jgi:FlaA1/EpsC-like NDP-sugar epimerase